MHTSIDLIRQAINERRILAFRYHALPREVEPTCLGETEHGKWQIRAYQVGGRSSSGRVGDGTPKLFELAAMLDVSVLPRVFEVPASYKRDDTAFIRIDTQL
jgi:hypothetical protein